MKLISAFELAQKSEIELNNLFSEVSQNLVLSDRGTIERLHALASLESIAHTRACQIAHSL